MVWLVLLLCFGVPLVIGALTVRHGAGWVVPVLAAVFLGLIVWAFYEMQQRQGWDRLSWALLAYIMAGPACLGVLTGGGAGLWLRRRAVRRGE